MLELDGVHVYYGRSHVLQGVSLTLRPGEVVALLGRNGAGKTTTLRSIAGLAPLGDGSISADGERIDRLRPHRIARSGVVFVASGNALLSSLTVKQNLVLAQRPIKGADAGWDLDRVVGVFPKLGQMWERRAGLLSGGERQMLKVARGLLMNPRYLLLDEPTEGLAPVIVNQLGEALRTLRGESMAILLCEQNANFALKLAERLYVLEKGVIRLDQAVDGASRDTLNRLLAVGE